MLFFSYKYIIHVVVFFFNINLIKTYFKFHKEQNPIYLTISQCGLYGFYAMKKNEEHVVICEKVSLFDKTRIYLRSTVQV